MDSRCFDLYGVDEADRQVIADGSGTAGDGDDNDYDGEFTRLTPTVADTASLVAELVSWTAGVAYGRFDVRLAAGPRGASAEPEPFEVLPVCPPGMLQNEKGLPLTKEDVARLQNAGQWHYPLDIPWDGILVDDPGHPLDIESRVQRVLELIWKDRWEADRAARRARSWASTACATTSASPARLLRRPPEAILQEPPPGTDLLAALLVRRRLHDLALLPPLPPRHALLGPERLRQAQAPARAAQARPPADRGRSAADAEPARGDRGPGIARRPSSKGSSRNSPRVAPLWNPDLNDGVIINFAPLWRLIGHTGWRKNVKECWDTLCAGDYDWSHLAMHLWPERVVPKCAEDASLAIAHGLDEVFWEKDDRDRLGQEGPAARRLAAGDRSTGRRTDQPGRKIGAREPARGALAERQHRRGRRGKAHA